MPTLAWWGKIRMRYAQVASCRLRCPGAIELRRWPPVPGATRDLMTSSCSGSGPDVGLPARPGALEPVSQGYDLDRFMVRLRRYLASSKLALRVRFSSPAPVA